MALCTASIVRTLRPPLHLTKPAASLDDMSKQRFLFGAATVDCPIQFPAFKVDSDDRAELFRESISVMLFLSRICRISPFWVRDILGQQLNG